MKVAAEELWFPIIVSLCIAALVKASVDITRGAISRRKALPPEGPFSANRVPFIGGFLWLRKSASEIEETLRSLHSKCSNSSAITVRFLSRPSIFVFSRSLAHKALVQSGALFADRPEPPEIGRIISCNQHNINSAGYGDTWRILRRNLTSQILHPSRLQAYSQARSWVLNILIDRLTCHGRAGKSDNSSAAAAAVRVVDHFRYAMFCLLVLMCFGDKLEEQEIRKVESAQHNMLVSLRRFQVLNVRPWLTKIILRGRWKEFSDLRKNQENVIIPLIRRRRSRGKSETENNLSVPCYVDSLLDLEVPDDDGFKNDGNVNTACRKKRKLTEMEMVSACSEFLNGGTDTTTTTLQWIMANLVKYPHIQAKLYEDIKEVVGSSEPRQQEAKQVLEEEDLSKINYLRAIVLEGLRRHPPGHFVLPHAVTQDVELDGFLFPKEAVINFMVADMGWDSEVWEDPMQFMPERFLPYLSPGNGFDITGSRDIKMMPFGAGRRICPAFNMAILHLEYFVANLVWKFEWKSADGYEVDLSEKSEFTIIMKHPLHCLIIPRAVG